MKTVVGVGYHLSTLNAQVASMSATCNEGKKKSAEPLTAQKKPQEATVSHSEPLKSHREPLPENEKRPTISIWSLARA